jgi:hypothetical protein
MIVTARQGGKEGRREGRNESQRNMTEKRKTIATRATHDADPTTD